MPLPYGYAINNGVVTVEDTKARIVQSIFRDYIQGLSAGKIADKLNASGISTASGTGRWHAQPVINILKKQCYTGNGLLPKIVEKTEFEKANTCRIQKTVKNRPAVEPSDKEIFKRMFCGSCGGRLSLRHINKNGSRYWYCRHCKAGLNDKKLKETFCSLLMEIKEDNNLLQPSEKLSVPENLQFQLLDSHIKRCIQSHSYSYDEIRRLIYERAVVEYNAMAPDGAAVTSQILAFINGTDISGTTIELIYCRTLQQISVHKENYSFYFKNQVICHRKISKDFN